MTFATRQLESVGFTPAQAEAIDSVMENKIHGAVKDLATKADLVTMRTEIKADLATMRAEIKADFATMRAENKADLADLYRALWMQGASIVAVIGVLLAITKAF